MPPIIERFDITEYTVEELYGERFISSNRSQCTKFCFKKPLFNPIMVKYKNKVYKDFIMESDNDTRKIGFNRNHE